ncbi:MAG: hypothetical protein J6W06_11350 [Bacteroidales bacterium]|jgi:hypothetical protein|nr:hypothetical protein [Bacteroidales bacterium]
MTRAEKKEIEALIADAVQKAVQQQSQKEWYTEEELFEKFGDASKSQLARFRHSGLVTIARVPYSQNKFLYSCADVDALVEASIVPKSKNQQYLIVYDEQFK